MPPFKLPLFGRPANLAAADIADTGANPAQAQPADPSLDTGAVDGSASKISRIIAAIGSPDGATAEELSALSGGWQSHTIRVASSRRRRKGMRIVHGADEVGRRVYRLTSDEAEA